VQRNFNWKLGRVSILAMGIERGPANVQWPVGQSRGDHAKKFPAGCALFKYDMGIRVGAVVLLQHDTKNGRARLTFGTGRSMWDQTLWASRRIRRPQLLAVAKPIHLYVFTQFLVHMEFLMVMFVFAFHLYSFPYRVVQCPNSNKTIVICGEFI
jgi:hypothetical protein